MKYILSFTLCLALTHPLLAQRNATDPKPATFNAYNSVDNKMLEIPASETNTTKDVARYINANFSTQKDKVRAAFIWTASSFEYDVPNMYALNFYESQQDKIDRVMKLRKGICENYAAVFNDICHKCNLTSYLVCGITRYNGQMADLAHAWCAVVIDGEYYIFDPTWGSGYVRDGVFTRRINNDYFMRPPAELIKSHLPFDPMLQMLNYPVSAQEFTDGKTGIDKTKPFFSYPDSIAAYEKATRLQQFEDEARRMEQNGIKTTISYNHFANLKRNIEVEKQNNLVNIYNAAVSEFNTTVRELNVFINYRNAQFTPTRTDAQIQGMIDSVNNSLLRVRAKMNGIKGKDAKTDELMIPFMKNLEEVESSVAEHNDFLKKYFPKNKIGRKAMFYKRL